MQLNGYFFPVQVAKALPEFDRSGVTNGTELDVEFEFIVRDTEKGNYGATLSLTVSEERSKNAPYYLEFVVVGAFNCAKEEAEDYKKLQFTAYSILVGALRERIASITSRGPFPRFIMSPVPIPKFDDAPSNDSTAIEASNKDK